MRYGVRSRKTLGAFVLCGAILGTALAGCGGEGSGADAKSAAGAAGAVSTTAEVSTTVDVTSTTVDVTSDAVGSDEVASDEVASTTTLDPRSAVDESAPDSATAGDVREFGGTPPAGPDALGELGALGALADGTYFGYVTAVDLRRSTIDFDAAQLLSGVAAIEQALADGAVSADDPTPPGGLYVVNKSLAVRTLRAAPGLVVELLAGPSSAELVSASLVRLENFVGLSTTVPDARGVTVQVVVANGQASRIVQHYLPTQ